MKTKSRAKKKPGFGGGNEPDGLLFDHNPLPMWVYDLETYQFLKVNHAAVKHYGYSEAEFKAMTIKDIRPREDVSRLVENVEHVTEGLEEAGIWRHLKKDGTLIYVEIVSHTLVFNGRGAELVVVMDVPEREAQFRALFENAPVGIGVSDMRGNLLAFNDAMMKPGGYSREDILEIGNVAALYYDQKQREEALALFKKQGFLHGYEVRFKGKDGAPYDAMLSLSTTIFNGQPCLQAIVENITERKRAEDALQKSEARLANILAFAAEAVIVVNEDQRIESFNNAAQKIFGYKEWEIVGKPLEILMPKRFAEIHRQYVKDFGASLEAERAMQGRGEIKCVRKDGSEFISEIGISRHIEGGRIYFTAIVMDITARRQAEKALRESEERYRGIFNGVRDAIFVETLDGKILAVNDPACEMYGYSRAEFITKTVQDLVPQGFPLLWADSPEGLLSSLPMITVNRRANGGLFPVEISGRLQTINGQKALLVVSRDITERQQAEDKIQRQIEYLSALRDIDEAIASALDVRISLQRLIAHATRLLQADAVAILLINSTENTLEYAAGSGFQTDAIRTTSIKIGESYAGRAAQERRVIQIPDLAKEPVNQFRTGFLEGEKFAGYYAAPLIVKGQVIGVIEVFQLSIISQTADWLDFFTTLAGQAAVAIDHARLIEDLKHSNLKLEKRVQERTAELERANRAKDEFLAAMSHELRTPLNSILGLSESLLEQRRDPLSDQQQASLQIIETSGRHLLELINDILDLSKIEAGKVDYYPQTVDVDTLCRSSMAFIREQSARKSITLNYREDHGVSSIHVDPRRVKQILVNLLANAVKFTPDHGGVELQVHADAERDLIQFAVRDTGIGIAEADLKRLFQPFVQVNGKLNRQFEGTGLGLALVQKLVDLHGGSVEVESELGKGSRFTVNLPWGRHLAARQEAIESGGAMPAPQQIEKPDFPPGKVPARGLILLAEDNMSNILTIGEYLESHGRRVIAARDGLEAIQIAEENNPDIILMDIQMPVMDGLEAIRRLRANPRFASTPIIALTALAMSGDRERCLQAGANEYMSKPVNLKALRRLIDSIFE